jgi:hypothetical protein
MSNTAHDRSRIRLSKSKILSGLQCPKRLWLEVHRPEYAEISPETERRFAAGDEVTEVARSLHVGGILVDAGHTEGNLEETQRRLRDGGRAPLFEATFEHDDVVVRTDVLTRGRDGFELEEVKSAASVKPPHYPDCAVQAWVLAGAGLALGALRLAHINSRFVYPGDGDYRGLFAGADLTEEIRPLVDEVPAHVRRFREVVAGGEPDISVGDHCTDPYPCPFIGYCAPTPAEYPVTCLPRGGRTAKALQAEGIEDIRDIPDGRLSSGTQEWVRAVTRSGRADLRTDRLDAIRDLPWPRYYLDFESVQFAVPIWKGTRPYEQLPFQWSLHLEHRNGNLAHREFLDTSGEAPMRSAAERLIEAAGTSGPIIVYSGFERARLRELAARFPRLAPAIDAIIGRLFDLLPVLKRSYYHPQMKGSWSMKSVLPAIAPHLDYEALGEVQDGGAAMAAYREMIHPATDPAREAQLEADLRRYCGHDTLGMVEIVRFLERALRG